jgi:hypothetical protein
MSYMRGDLLTKMRKLVKGLARPEPRWLKAMEESVHLSLSPSLAVPLHLHFSSSRSIRDAVRVRTIDHLVAVDGFS